MFNLFKNFFRRKTESNAAPPISLISPIRPITSIPPISEAVAPDSAIKENGPIAFPSPGGEGKGEGEQTTNIDGDAAPRSPSGSPEGCGTLAGDNIPGKEPPITSHPEGVPENTASLFPLEPSNKRNGKIAKLPRTLRDRINQAIDLGQSGVSIAQHLNQLPEVKAMLNAHFDGKPISQQNLSEWKAGGYRDWQLRQELIVQHKEFTADIHELGQTAHGMADALFGMLLFDYARLIKNKDKETPESFEKKLKALNAQTDSIVKLRRCEVQARNVEVQESRLERDREKTQEELFQKFMEWADNPAVRKAFILAPEARMAAQRQNFGLPPRPQDAAVMAEFQPATDSAQTPENQGNQTEIKPSPTEKPGTPSCPGGTTENSPAFERRDNVTPNPSPEGTTEHAPAATLRPISPIRPIAQEDKGKLDAPRTAQQASTSSPWDSFSEPCGSHTPRAHAYPPYENPLKYYGPCPPPQTPGSRWKVRGI